MILCDAAADLSAERELADRGADWLRPSRIRTSGPKTGVEDYGALLEDHSPLNEAGKEGRFMAYGNCGTRIDMAAQACIPIYPAEYGIFVPFINVVMDLRREA